MLIFREAISAVCDRNGVDVDTINVYLESSRTPLPLLTSETSWLGGRHIRIRAKVSVTFAHLNRDKTKSESSVL